MKQGDKLQPPRPPKKERVSFRLPPGLFEETAENAYPQGEDVTAAVVWGLREYNKRADANRRRREQRAAAR